MITHLVHLIRQLIDKNYKYHLRDSYEAGFMAGAAASQAAGEDLTHGYHQGQHLWRVVSWSTRRPKSECRVCGGVGVVTAQAAVYPVTIQCPYCHNMGVEYVESAVREYVIDELTLNYHNNSLHAVCRAIPDRDSTPFNGLYTAQYDETTGRMDDCYRTKEEAEAAMIALMAAADGMQDRWLQAHRFAETEANHGDQ